jgi:hypothetical protein
LPKLILGVKFTDGKTGKAKFWNGVSVTLPFDHIATSMNGPLFAPVPVVTKVAHKVCEIIVQCLYRRSQE